MSGSESFVVVGCGQVGYRVTSLLLALGKKVTVVTQEVRQDWRRILEENQVEILTGDANDRDLLVRAGVQGATAVLACTTSDAVNIRISLEAKRIDPNVKVVARLFDQLLADRLEHGIGIDRALAMSVVAAPSFASAALGNDVVGEFHLDDKRFLLVRHDVHDQSELAGMTPHEIKDKYGAETILRVDAQGKSKTDVRHHDPLGTGETVKFIGEPHALVALVPAVGSAPGRKPVSKRRARNLWKTVPSSLKVLTLAVLGLTATSVLVFNLAMGLRPIDALYFVVTTLTTTGYGDINAKDANDWLKVYTCVLMILGSAIVAVLYSIITDFIVTTRFRELAGEKPVPEGGHVVVVGVGNVGYRVVQELRDGGVEVVAVDSDADTPYAVAVRDRVPFVTGDGRESETLDRANLSKARSVVVTTEDDAVNLSVGLLSKQKAPNVRTVLRIFDAGFAAAVRDVLDIDEALSASRLAAPEFVAAAMFPDTIAAFVLRGHLVALTKGGEGGRVVEVGGTMVHVHGMALTRSHIFDTA